MRQIIVTLLCLVYSAAVNADLNGDLTRYEAPLDYAKWVLSGSPIQCSLTQDIPKYGFATFSSAANRKSNMNFNLALRHYNPTRATEAVLSVEPPLWKHDKDSQEVGPITMFPGTIPLNIKNHDAWRLLFQLEKGMFPTFSYDSWLEDSDKVSVALSAVNFQPVYEQFLDCVANLLPYSFDDISESFVYFEFNSNSFTREARESLAKIGAWLEVDKSLELVLLAGHTDGKGASKVNYKVGKKRAEMVKKFFVESGIAANKIRTQSFAATQPQSSNATPEGRAKNRRVMIKMVK